MDPLACLIAPFVDSAQPSEAFLDTVRLWVRFYDVPCMEEVDKGVWRDLAGLKI
jgi:hypothetical protein